MKKHYSKIVMAALLAVMGAGELHAQSAIYACGHIRRTRTTAIQNLKNSGYTTAILFNVDVAPDGTLITDYSWDIQEAAEAGGIICQDGEYVFDRYQPHYVDDIKSLLAEPTSINRIEICIGGWGNGAYGHIRDLIKAHGTGEETALYRNFKALKEAIPEIVALAVIYVLHRMKHNALLKYIHENSTEDTPLFGGIILQQGSNWLYSKLPIENTTDTLNWNSFYPENA